MPLHVRAGAIVPLAPVRQHVDEPAADPLALVVYPGADGAFMLYEDDGRTFEYRRGDWMGVELRWTDRARRLSLRLVKGSRMRPPAPRPIVVRLAGEASTRPVLFAGRPLDVAF
jgi:hypothetical protein